MINTFLLRALRTDHLLNISSRCKNRYTWQKETLTPGRNCRHEEDEKSHFEFDFYWGMICKLQCKTMQMFSTRLCQAGVIKHRFITHRHSLTSSSFLPLLLGVMGAGSLKTEVFTTQRSALEFLELHEHVGLALWHHRLSLKIDRLAIWLFCIRVHLSVCTHLPVYLSVLCS